MLPPWTPAKPLPNAERNEQPILDVLARVLPAKGLVLGRPAGNGAGSQGGAPSMSFSAHTFR